MKVVILAGGMGTRLSEETTARPKPMVEIGGHPIIWHIMQIYSAHQYTDFIVACGYKSQQIKEYFRNFFAFQNDLVIDLRSGGYEAINPSTSPWKVAIVDTGLHTMTGGRLLRLRSWLQGEAFMVTYGDGVGDIDIAALVKFHRSHGRLATVTGVRPPARFGGLVLQGAQVCQFTEKNQAAEGWISGGFFVFEPAVLDLIAGDDIMLEKEPLEQLANAGQLMAFRHEGFWQPMDTIREKQLLESLWSGGKAAWKVWP